MEDSPNGRRAKYYRLTPSGRKHLVVATSKWQRFVEAMGRVLSPVTVTTMQQWWAKLRAVFGAIASIGR